MGMLALSTIALGCAIAGSTGCQQTPEGLQQPPAQVAEIQKTSSFAPRIKARRQIQLYTLLLPNRPRTFSFAGKRGERGWIILELEQADAIRYVKENKLQFSIIDQKGQRVERRWREVAPGRWKTEVDHTRAQIYYVHLQNQADEPLSVKLTIRQGLPPQQLSAVTRQSGATP